MQIYLVTIDDMLAQMFEMLAQMCENLNISREWKNGPLSSVWII